MLIKGSIGGRNKSFNELLEKISESFHRNSLLKTIYNCEYYTDGVILTKLTSLEKESINKIHLDTIVTDTEYKKTKSLNIKQAVPRYLRCECNKIESVGGDKKLRLVKITSGNGVKAYMEEGSFNTFYQRINFLMSGRMMVDASWWFSRKDGPIVVLDMGGFNQGKLIGTIAQFKLEQQEEICLGKPKLKRIYKPNIGWMYKSIGGEDDSSK